MLLSKARNFILVMFVTCLALGAAEGGLSLKPTELTPHDTGLVTSTMMIMHFREHKMTPDLARRTVRQMVDHLDPMKVFYTDAEAKAISSMSNEDALKAGEDFAKGKYGAVHDTIENFKKTLARDDEFLKGLEKNADRIKQIAAQDPKMPKDRAPTEEGRREKILTWAAILYKATAEYQDEADAMRMACNSVRRSYSKWLKEQTVNEELTLYLKCFSNALDPHTNYLEPDDNFYKSLDANFVGIGVMVRPGSVGAFIDKVIEGGSAFASGKFERGDQIIAVDGVDVSGMEVDDIVKKVKGEAGTEVKVTLLKHDTKKAVEVTLKRVVIKAAQSMLKASVVNTPQGPVGVVAIASFYDGMAADVRQKILELKKQGIVGIVLDLRDNGGGLLNEAVELVALFVPQGPITATWDGRGKPNWYTKTRHAVTYDGPLTVLVNQRSASASEMTSGALQDLGRAIIIGSSRTFGKGSAQGGSLLLDLFIPGQIAITMQMYFLPSGGSVQLKGVTPDIGIPGSKVEDMDLESHYPDAIEGTTIDAGANEKTNPDMAGWRKWRDSHLKDLAKASGKRVEKNKDFQAAFEEGAKAKPDAPDYQAEEAATVTGEMSKEWK